MSKRQPKKPTAVARPDRTESGRFRPGVSGNPGGRGKDVRELLERARSMCPDVLTGLWEMFQNTEARAADRIEVGKVLLAYGIGSPPKVVQLDDPFEGVSEDELRQRIRAAVLEEASLAGGPH